MLEKSHLKILFVIRSWDHFSYHESTVYELCSAGHSVTALFDPKWCDGYTTDEPVRKFAENTGNFYWDYLVPRSGWPSLLVLGIRELRNYVRYLRYPEQSSFYLKRVEAKFPKIIRRVLRLGLVQKSLASDIIWRFFEAFEQRIPPPGGIIKRIKEYQPDVILASPVNLWWSQEVDYVKAGKKLGIPTVILVFSWDNVTTKGVFHEVPDLTLVWNEAHFSEALKIQMPADRMVIAGAPVFDRWLRHEISPTERALFCKKVGLDPGKPIVIYLGSSQNIAKDESWIVEALAKELRVSSDENLRNLQILVRPHPANSQGFSKISIPNVVVWPPGGSLPDTQTSFQDFYDTLFHSKCTIGLNTSGMLDALVFGKPGITILVDRYAATQIEALHYQHLFMADALEVSRDIPETIDRISCILRGQDTKLPLRKQFVRNFIRPKGESVPAGKVAAMATEMIGMGKEPFEIEAILSKNSLTRS